MIVVLVVNDDGGSGSSSGVVGGNGGGEDDDLFDSLLNMTKDTSSLGNFPDRLSNVQIFLKEMQKRKHRLK